MREVGGGRILSFIVVIIPNFLRDIAVYAKDASAVDKNLGEDVQHRSYSNI